MQSVRTSLVRAFCSFYFTFLMQIMVKKSSPAPKHKQSGIYCLSIYIMKNAEILNYYYLFVLKFGFTFEDNNYMLINELEGLKSDF